MGTEQREKVELKMIAALVVTAALVGRRRSVPHTYWCPSWLLGLVGAPVGVPMPGATGT